MTTMLVLGLYREKFDLNLEQTSLFGEHEVPTHRGDAEIHVKIGHKLVNINI